jgi:hypothetical protein
MLEFLRGWERGLNQASLNCKLQWNALISHSSMLVDEMVNECTDF